MAERVTAIKKSGRIRVAFPLIGSGAWTGGYVYLKNSLRLINSRLRDEIEPSVFLSPAEHEKYGDELSEIVNGRLIVDAALGRAGRGASLARAILAGRDRALEVILMRAGTQVAFEVAGFYGSRFALPVISWITDFQHRHMPAMFGQANWWRRDLGFRIQVSSNRTLMASSETARADMEHFYPASRGRVHVVRFAVEIDIERLVKRYKEVRSLYDINNRFFFLPNQFWRHKNHAVIVRALARLKAENRLRGLPPILLSGLPIDSRDPGHFDRLMAEVQQAGIASHFRYLGLIPYDDVLTLIACCDGLVNPSRFEGWSTPIEEAKALGAPLLLSDIPIHREQAPHARFFNPASDEAAAESLIALASPSVTRRNVLDLVNAQHKRLEDHAGRLLTTVRAAASCP